MGTVCGDDFVDTKKEVAADDDDDCEAGKFCVILLWFATLCDDFAYFPPSQCL